MQVSDLPNTASSLLLRCRSVLPHDCLPPPTLDLITAACRVLCLTLVDLDFSRSQAPVARARLQCTLAASVCSRQPNRPLLHPARRHRHRLTLHLLQRSAPPPLYYASPPCAVRCCASVLSSLAAHRHPARQIVLPHHIQRLACRNPRATRFHMLVDRHPGPFPPALLCRHPPRLNTSTTTFALHPSPTIHSTLVGLFLADSKH